MKMPTISEINAKISTLEKEKEQWWKLNNKTRAEQAQGNINYYQNLIKKSLVHYLPF